MSIRTKIEMALVGAGSLSRSIAQHDTPIRGIRAAHIDPEAGASSVSDPQYPVVVIDSGSEEQGRLVGRALQSGKLVVSSFPPAFTTEELQVIADLVGKGGKLVTVPDLATYSTCRDALAAFRDGHVGKLQSIYIAYRLPRSDVDQSSILDDIGWAVIDLLVEITEKMPTRVFASGGSLFGANDVLDTISMVLRFPDDVVATIELSRCLTAAPLNSSTVDVEAEIIGSSGAIRVAPKGGFSDVSTPNHRFQQAWSDERVLPLMEQILSVMQNGDQPANRLRYAAQAVEIRTAIDKSLSSDSAITLTSQ